MCRFRVVNSDLKCFLEPEKKRPDEELIREYEGRMRDLQSFLSFPLEHDLARDEEAREAYTRMLGLYAGGVTRRISALYVGSSNAGCFFQEPDEDEVRKQEDRVSEALDFLRFPLEHDLMSDKEARDSYMQRMKLYMDYIK